MGRIKFAKVVSFSSEDPSCPANDLLKDSTKLKWQCQNVGENKAFVTLQLENPSLIRSVDIVNNNSAFVEILVGRTGMSESEYKLLLPNSSLMTPIDSRNGVNGNRVRMFGPDKLSGDVYKEKWDILKVVCTQPFNSHIKYGVSFIAVHEQENEKPKEPALPSIGGLFKMKEEKDTSAKLDIGSMFQRLKAANGTPNIKTSNLSLADAALKEAERTVNNLKKAPALSPSKVKVTEPPREFVVIPPQNKCVEKRNADKDENLPRRNRLNWDDDGDVVDDQSSSVAHKDSPKLSSKHLSKASPRDGNKKTVASAKSNLSTTRSTPTTPKLGVTQAKTSGPKVPQSNESKSPRSALPPKSLDFKGKAADSNGLERATAQSQKPVKSSKPVQKRPFKELMKGAVFAMSGFVNPKRGQLRDMAVEMGARYRPDWDDTCTHLICAFLNTPKFKEVFGKGKIVKEQWITECHKQRKRLPWRRFCLDRRDRGPDSEEEIWSTDLKDTSDNDGAAVADAAEPLPKVATKRNSEAITLEDEKEDLEKSDDDSDYEASTDYSSDEFTNGRPQAKKRRTSNVDPPDLVDLSDDENDANRNSLTTSTSTPKFFKGYSFYLDSELTVKEKIECAREISIHGGTICKNLDSITEFYVAWATDVDRLRTVRMDFPNLKLVAPLWIEDCKNSKKFCLMTSMNWFCKHDYNRFCV